MTSRIIYLLLTPNSKLQRPYSPTELTTESRNDHLQTTASLFASKAARAQGCYVNLHRLLTAELLPKASLLGRKKMIPPGWLNPLPSSHTLGQVAANVCEFPEECLFLLQKMENFPFLIKYTYVFNDLNPTQRFRKDAHKRRGPLSLVPSLGAELVQKSLCGNSINSSTGLGPSLSSPPKNWVLLMAFYCLHSLQKKKKKKNPVISFSFSHPLL